MTAAVPRLLDPIDAITGATAAGLPGNQRWPARRVWRWVVISGLLALFGAESTLIMPYLANAFDALADPDPWWVLVAVIAELTSMGAFARMQRRMLSAAGQRVPMRPMVGLTYAANALSVTFPGGTALSSGYVFKRLRSWGATVPAAGFTVVASGVLSLVAFAVLAVGSGLWAGDSLLSSMLTLVTALAIAVTALVVRRRRPAGVAQRVLTGGLSRVNRVLRRRPDAGLATVQRFARDLTAIRPRSRDWLAGLALAGLNWVADLICLLACCEAVGANRATLALVMLAYVAGMSASSISLLPGGFGIVDAAMIFALTSGGVSTVSATAAVVLYRLISFLFVVAIGWVAWVGSWLVEHRRTVTPPAVGAQRPAPSVPAAGSAAATSVIAS